MEEAKKALQANDFNKQPAYKKVDWLRVGGAFLGALVVGAAVAFTMGAALPILGAAAATGMAAMGASCGTIALAGTIAMTIMQVIGTFGMLAGAYYSYKRWEESGFDLEEGLVILAEALGGAIGGGIGGKYGLKVGNKAVEKFFGNNPNYLAFKNGTKCFIAGTLIATEKGKKRIEELKYGEKVYSYDKFYKEKALRRIRDVHEHITDTFVRIKTKTEEILTTPEHPFYVKGRYILASFLSVGMSLTSFAGEQIEIQETEIIRYEKPQKVYNFSIEGTENYYVGEQGVLVHNAGGCPSGNEVKKKNTETKKKMDEVEIEFKKNPKHSGKELSRQLSGQEEGMNKLSIEEYKANREKFKAEGRDKSSKALQKEYREKALQTKIKELRKTENLTQSEAEKRAKEWISGKAALHDPDQIAGGYANRITGMGDSRVNSSIGSQWRSRIGSVDEAVDNYIKANNIPKSEWGNIYLNVKLVY